MLLAPFLPFSSQRLHELLGYEDVIAGALEFRTVERGRRRARRPHGRLRVVGRVAGSRASSPPGQALREPTPLFEKLDPEQRRRRGARADGGRRSRRVIDTHAHLDACDEPPDDARRARARRRESRGSSRSGPGSSRAAPRSTSPTRTTACTPRSGSIRTRPATAEADRLDELRELLRHPEGGRGRGDGPRHFRGTRRREQQRGSSRRSSSSPTSCGCPSSSTPARRTTTPRPRSRASAARSSSTASRRRGSLTLAVERGYYVSFAGNVTYPKAAAPAGRGRTDPGRPDPRRDGQPVPGAAAGPRASERARERRPHDRRARRGARRGRSPSWLPRRTRTPRPPSGCRDRRAEEVARPALPRRREHPRRHRPPSRARRDDVVLEVGPGLGVLTRYLADRAARRPRGRARPLARARAPRALEERSNVEFVWATRSTSTSTTLDPQPTKLVANLPYNVATPLVVETLEHAPSLVRWCVMVQREVADRFFAEPRTKAYGAVSVLVQLSARKTGFHPRAADRVPSTAARRVRARRLRARARSPPIADVRPVVEAAFAHRRKTLANSLAHHGARDRERRRRRRSRTIGRAAERAGRGARARGVRRLAEALPMSSATAYAKINLALVVGPLRDDGKHEVVTVLAADRPPRRRSRSSPAEALVVEGFAEDTIVRAALEALADAAGAEPAGACGSRSGSRSLPGSEAEAPTRRRRSGSRTRRSTRPLASRRAARPRRAHRRRRPVLPRGRGAARDGRRDGARAARPPARLPVVLVVPDDGGRRRRRGRLRRVRGARRRRRVRRPSQPHSPQRSPRSRDARDLAGLPRNDLASSPLATRARACRARSARTSRAPARPCTASSRTSDGAARAACRVALERRRGRSSRARPRRAIARRVAR